MTINNNAFLPGVLADHQIRDLCLQSDRPMITPFNEKLKEHGVISYGLSSYGYDATLAPKIKIAKDPQTIVDEFSAKYRVENSIDLFDDTQAKEWLKKVDEFEKSDSVVLDPKNPNPDFFYEVEGDSFILPPHGFALGYTNEFFDIPDDVIALCLGKSTYARSSIHVLVTPMEPGWRGQLVVEVTNNSSIPTRVYTNEGIAQFVFLKGSDKCETPYSTRGGKYMDQTGITMGKIVS
jgi:dCTP deaminase